MKKSFSPKWEWIFPSVALASGATPASACSVIPYFMMLFQGSEEHTLRLGQGFALALGIVVLLKAWLLDRRLRAIEATPGRSPWRTFPLTLATVAAANVVSLVSGYFALVSFATTGGVQVMYLPMIALGAGLGWFAILKWQVRQHVDVSPIRIGWLVLMMLAGFLLYPLTGALLLLSMGLVFLLPVVLLGWALAIRVGFLARPAEPAPDAGERSTFEQGLTCLCGMGLSCGVIGKSLLDKGQGLALTAPGDQVAAYWAMKVFIVTSLFGIALISTTAIEAIVLLPFYRYLFEGRPGSPAAAAEPMDQYQAFFGDLFRINGAAVAVVLFLFALQTLPTRLGMPGFLY